MLRRSKQAIQQMNGRHDPSTWRRNLKSGSISENGDLAILGRDPVKPGALCRIGRSAETLFLRHMDAGDDEMGN